jgi:hypothetical protein
MASKYVIELSETEERVLRHRAGQYTRPHREVTQDIRPPRDARLDALDEALTGAVRRAAHFTTAATASSSAWPSVAS